MNLKALDMSKALRLALKRCRNGDLPEGRGQATTFYALEKKGLVSRAPTGEYRQTDLGRQVDLHYHGPKGPGPRGLTE